MQLTFQCSGRNYLWIRQACAVEAAANAHLDQDFVVVVVMTSDTLSLTHNNSTKLVRSGIMTSWLTLKSFNQIIILLEARLVLDYYHLNLE